MPIFDYTCPKCGEKKENEMVRKYDDPVHCDKCETQMVKGISAPTIAGMDKYGSSK